jgi:hypothetical protein
MDMGWGVRFQDTYVNRLEHWLSAHSERLWPSKPQRFEVLNFAVAAYSPLQRLDTLKRKAMAFRPDLVIYSATTLDIRLLEIHVCDMLRQHVDLKYEFLREAIKNAGVNEHDLLVDSAGEMINKTRLKSKLRPSYWGLYDTTLGEIASECRRASVPVVMVIIPRVGKADAPSARALPVARLTAIAAHNGVQVIDLADAFDELDPARIEIAAWDDHPNATGHRRLFVALARALTQDQELYQLLFAPSRAHEAGDAGSASERPDP